MHTLLKHPLGDCDVEEAALWYNQRDHEVALRFAEEARLAMRAAAHDPHRFSQRLPGIRRVRLRGFPHSVFFRVQDGTVFVLAVLHGACDPAQLLQGRMRI